MQMSKEDYFFFEWLILSKGMSEEDFSKLSSGEVDALHSEWRVFYYGTK
jgi:hypothetical protein